MANACMNPCAVTPSSSAAASLDKGNMDETDWDIESFDYPALPPVGESQKSKRRHIREQLKVQELSESVIRLAPKRTGTVF